MQGECAVSLIPPNNRKKGDRKLLVSGLFAPVANLAAQGLASSIVPNSELPKF